jgi:hypothetical protein
LSAFNPPPEPEIELLLFCARRTRTPGQAAAIRSLLAAPLNWRFLLSLAGRHRVLTLLYAALKSESCLELLPPAFRDALHSAARESIGQSLALTRELVRILQEFERRGIPAIPCKGPVVGILAYGDLSYRSFCDLDILVPESHFHIAERVLASLGYHAMLRLSAKQEEVYLNNECAMPFQGEANGHIVELHWRLCERNASVRLPLSALWQRAVPVPLLGMTVPSLAPEDLVLYLCVHGAKHRWERIEWVASIAEIARRHSELDWQATFERADRYRVARLLRVGLHLASSLPGVELPEPVRAKIDLDPGARALAESVRDEWFVPAGAGTHYQRRAVRYLFMMRSREHWADRLRILFYSAIRPPHPSANEWIDLPPRLAFLHRIFRPVRLLGEYSAVAWKHYVR